MLTHLDLFSGIGGFALAAQWAGFRTVGFCEREPYAQQVLKERFGAVAHTPCGQSGEQTKRQGRQDISRGSPQIHDNIFTLNGRDYAGVSLITGGFPCQPFSVVGKRLGAADDRAIWPQMLRVIDEARPAWVLGENVAGIVNMELDNVLSDLEGLGYAAWPLVIPACAVDAKHRRDRVWIVAHSARELQHGGRESRNGGRQYPDGGEDVADAATQRRQGQGEHIKRGGFETSGEGKASDVEPVSQPCHWSVEPELGRVAHGIPHRAHRLRGLGNAIVPQVAFQILREIRNQITP